MSGKRADEIGNEATLEYGRRFGALKVKGGYNIYKGASIIPTYTPGSMQSIIFMLACLLIALILFVVIIKAQRS